jgi:hypothetical protein
MAEIGRKWQSLIAWSTALFVLGVLGYVGYLWLTYIDKATTEGQAYGLSIGNSKQEVFAKLPSAFHEAGRPGTSVFVELVVNSNGSASSGQSGRHVLTEVRPDTLSFDELSQSNVWRFYLSDSYSDSLALKFCSDKLCRIYRHRKKFELP